MSLRNMMTQRKQRISHPFARYNATGNLICSLCNTQVKHEQLWAAHLTSKTHRANVQIQQQQQAHEAAQRQKEEEQQRILQEQEELAASRKRTAEDEQDGVANEGTSRKRLRSGDIQGSVEQATEDTEMNDEDATSNLPPGFFDSVPPPTSAPAANGTEDDEEWLAFERDILAEPVASTSTAPLYPSAATISAKAKLVDEDGNLIEDEAEPSGPKVNADGTIDEPDQQIPGESEAERREREDREELMARIEEEEREQQEADQRVAMLKNRIQLLRQKKQQQQSKGA